MERKTLGEIIRKHLSKCINCFPSVGKSPTPMSKSETDYAYTHSLGRKGLSERKGETMAYYNTYAVIERNKERILDALEKLYDRLDKPMTELARKRIEREIKLYEEEFEAWDANGFCEI